jgi:hypothetical protein
MAAGLVTLWLGDHQALLRGYLEQNMILDRAYVDNAELIRVLEGLLGGSSQVSVRRVKVRRIDLVNDSTNVDVYYRMRS